jgi:two-component system, LytTR family, sensor kinase
MTTPGHPTAGDPTPIRRFMFLAAALTVPAAAVATQLYWGYRLGGQRVPFLAALAVQLCHWEPWAVAGPAVWGLERRWPMVPGRRRAALLRHLVAAPTVATAVLATFLVGYHILVRLPFVSAWFAGLDRSLASTSLFFVVSYFHVELLIYAGIVAAAHAARASTLLRAREHEALRLEAELTGAKLTALRTQLQPHFLFNALHTVGSLVLQRQNDRAVQILAELGELLRATLAHRDTELTPLRDEVAYLRLYLRIEEVRFGDRLTVRWELDPAALDASIPPFILQPLVENAFRHGISRRPEPSTLRIRAEIEGSALRITVHNDGPPLSAEFTTHGRTGYGLRNVAQRLGARNPPGRLELANASGGVRASLVLPLRDGPSGRSAG